jgi:hypothetical protein
MGFHSFFLIETSIAKDGCKSNHRSMRKNDFPHAACGFSNKFCLKNQFIEREREP